MSPMFLKIGVYVALAACALGLAYKLRLWLTVAIGPEARGISAGQRAAAALGGALRVIFSPALGKMLAALVMDGLVQRRVWNHSRLAWVTHQCIFLGFTGLLLMHALGDIVTKAIWSGYYPTVQPYLFLRNVFGAMVVVGVGLAIYRRVKLADLKRTTRLVDQFALILVGLILVSGFALEGVKIISHQSFDRMVKEYPPGGGEPDEIADLETYWAKEYGVVFPAGRGQGDAKALERGRKLNEDTCLDCHAPAHTAFLSYALGKALSPIGVGLAGGENTLWYMHVLFCLIGLAILPFTKFLHLFTTPLLLMIRAAAPRDQLSPANLATLRAYELDACTHCAACSLHCSVALAMKEVPNLNILPSEKLASLMSICGARPGQPSDRELRVIRQGAYICTGCRRCTDLCTAGINLQDLWLAMKADLAERGLGAPIADVRQALCRAAEPSRQSGVVHLNGQKATRRELKGAIAAANFSNCFRCMTCTNSCPVVHSYTWPMKELDLMPHQIMHSLGLGLKEEALGARMTWNCLTCYRCQEACPQGVLVADILYELRHLASAKAADLEG